MLAVMMIAKWGLRTTGRGNEEQRDEALLHYYFRRATVGVRLRYPDPARPNYTAVRRLYAE